MTSRMWMRNSKVGEEKGMAMECAREVWVLQAKEESVCAGGGS